MNGTSSWFLRRLGYRGTGEEAEIHTVEELRLLVEDTEEDGLLDPDAADMVLNVFALADKTVRDCMVPRDKMVALDVNTPPAKVLEVARLGAHTRMPVYDGNLDNIVGIVNTKDLFFLFSTSGAVVLEDALYPPTFLDPDEPVANAFRLFRRSHRPMAVVRDTSGTVLGLHNARRRAGGDRRRHRGRARCAGAEAETGAPPSRANEGRPLGREQAARHAEVVVSGQWPVPWPVQDKDRKAFTPMVFFTGH